MSEGLPGSPRGPHSRSPPARLPQGPSASCSSSTCCSPASGSSPCSTWPGSFSTGTRRRKVGWPCPPFLQLCSRVGVGSPFLRVPPRKWGAPHPPCSFPPLHHHQHHKGKRDAAGPRGAFPRDPAARWAGLGWASSPVAPPGFAGGRRLPCLRRWTVWKHFRDYFPVKVRPGRDGTTQKAVPRSRPRDPFCLRSW